MKFNALFKIRKEDHIEFLNEMTPLLDKGIEIKYSPSFIQKYPYNTTERVNVLMNLFRDVGIYNLNKNFLLFEKIPLFKQYKYITEFGYKGFSIKKEKNEKYIGVEDEYFFNNKIQNHVENQVKLIKNYLENSLHPNKSGSVQLQAYADRIFKNLEIIFEEVLNTKLKNKKNIIENFNTDIVQTDSWFIYSIIIHFILDNDPKHNAILPVIKSLKEIDQSKKDVIDDLIKIAKGDKLLDDDFLDNQFKLYNLIFFGNEGSSK